MYRPRRTFLHITQHMCYSVLEYCNIVCVSAIRQYCAMVFVAFQGTVNNVSCWIADSHHMNTFVVQSVYERMSFPNISPLRTCADLIVVSRSLFASVVNYSRHQVRRACILELLDCIKTLLDVRWIFGVNAWLITRTEIGLQIDSVIVSIWTLSPVRCHSQWLRRKISNQMWIICFHFVTRVPQNAEKSVTNSHSIFARSPHQLT